MRCLLPTPITKLFKFELPLHGLFVLADRVVHVLARRAAEPDEFFGEFSLCHAKFV